jgi:hypothetical protein
VNRERHALVQVKSSLAAMAPALGYRLTDRGVKWLGRSDLSANDILGSDTGISREDRRADAEAWLTDAVGAGPLPATEVLSAGKATGFSEKMLRAAADALGVQKRRVSSGNRGQGRFEWSLPQLDPFPVHGDGQVAKNLANPCPERGSQLGQGPAPGKLPEPASLADLAPVSQLALGPTPERGQVAGDAP